MSALPPKADIGTHPLNVRFVPKADIRAAAGCDATSRPAGGWPSAAVTQMAAFNPFGVYMQIVQQWQKACTDAMGFWTKVDRPSSWRTPPYLPLS